MASYRRSNGEDPGDGRLFAPTFLRNSPPMIATLAAILADRTGPVLEIGAGTGQHAAAFALAFPALDWWPSEPDPLHRKSISAWQAAQRAPNNAPLQIDASSDWAMVPAVRALGPLEIVLSMNVIHITPIAVSQGIVAGAGKTLAPGGLLIFYGPFREYGKHTGAGNEAFDQGLRSENPKWGVRDIAEIDALAIDAGLQQVSLTVMPANNRLLVYKKASQAD